MRTIRTNRKEFLKYFGIFINYSQMMKRGREKGYVRIYTITKEKKTSKIIEKVFSFLVVCDDVLIPKFRRRLHEFHSGMMFLDILSPYVSLQKRLYSPTFRRSFRYK